MIRRYNWNLITKYCKGDPITIVGFLRECIGIKTNKKLPIKLKRLSRGGVPKGVSYILNLDELLRDKSASVYNIVQYIELCSRRNFADYKFHNITTLPGVAAYDTNVQYNRLLIVDNRKILFKYE